MADWAQSTNKLTNCNVCFQLQINCFLTTGSNSYFLSTPRSRKWEWSPWKLCFTGSSCALFNSSITTLHWIRQMGKEFYFQAIENICWYKTAPSCPNSQLGVGGRENITLLWLPIAIWIALYGHNIVTQCVKLCWLLVSERDWEFTGSSTPSQKEYVNFTYS